MSINASFTVGMLFVGAGIVLMLKPSFPIGLMISGLKFNQAISKKLHLPYFPWEIRITPGVNLLSRLLGILIIFLGISIIQDS